MDNMQKGKLAENLVRDMFKEAGFKVIRYGYEHTVPSLADKDNLIQGLVGHYIRHQPDFIVVNGNNEAFFVEVKYRSFKIGQKEIYNYPNCYVILLTKHGMYAQSTSYIHKKGYDFTHPNKMPPFSDIPIKTIEKHEKRIRRKFGKENLIGQMLEGLAVKITNKDFKQSKPSIFTIEKDKPFVNKIIVRTPKIERTKRKRSERGFSCIICGRKINHRGKCLPCNKKAKRRRK